MSLLSETHALPSLARLKADLRAYFALTKYFTVGLAPAYSLAEKVTRASAVPVLAYHMVTATAEAAEKLLCSVSVATFEKHMSWLRDDGYRPLSVAEYTRCIRSRRGFPEKSVLITFDDGYRSTFTRAYPILQRYRFPAVVFVATGSIGELRFPPDEVYGPLPSALADELLPMTWSEVQRITDVFAIGGHSVTHGRLGRMDGSTIDWEVRECKRVLESKLLGPVTWFAYPNGIKQHGDHNDATREALVGAGYEVAFTSEIGRNRANTDPFSQRRIEPKEDDTRALFEAKLVGGQDWARPAQAAYHLAFQPEGI